MSTTNENRWRMVQRNLDGQIFRFEFTGSRAMANDYLDALRQGYPGMMNDLTEVNPPINSRENPILDEFRDMLSGLLEPHSPSQATWWLQLLEWDPNMENTNYWGQMLPDSIEPRHIGEAKRVLTRLRDTAKG